MGLSNRNISKGGTTFDKLITELGFGDVSYKQGFEEARLVKELIDKYPTHEARAEALKELRGEKPTAPLFFRELSLAFQSLPEVWWLCRRF